MVGESLDHEKDLKPVTQRDAIIGTLFRYEKLWRLPNTQITDSYC